MPTFSRWMPRVPETKWDTRTLVFASGLALGGLWLVIAHPWLLACVAGIGAVGYLIDRPHRARMRRCAHERRGDSICTFARDLPRHERDAWIIRALYEELAPYARIGDEQVALHPSDRLREDLGVDDEDLEDVGVAVAERVGRSMEGCEANEYFGRVHTVADLIAFLRRQPFRTG